MPENIFLRKKKTADANPMFGEQVQQENMYAQQFQAFQEQNEQLQSSKRSVLGIKRQDSSEMTDVKQSMTFLEQFLNKTISVDPLEFENQLDKLKELYTAVINKCVQYIKTRKPITKSGKARLNIVKTIYFQACREQEHLDEAARSVFDQADGTILWANILHETRCAHLIVDEHITDIGNGSSEVYKLPFAGQNVYFKPMEAVPTDDYDTLVNEYYEKNKDHVEGLDAIRDEVMSRKQFMSDLLPNITDAFIEVGLPINSEAPYTQEQVDRFFTSSWVIGTASFKEDSQIRHAENFQKFYPLARSINKASNAKFVCQCAKIESDQNVSQRNVATSRVAKILGISNIIAESRMASVRFGNQPPQSGIIMKEAKGTSFTKLALEESDLPLEYSPQSLKQLCTLHLFDGLCGQIDRNDSNFLMQFEIVDGKRVISTVTGIDNDMSFGNLSVETMREGTLNAKKLVSRDGEFTIPGVDREFYEHLKALNDETIQYMLKDLVSENNIEAFKMRLNGLLELIETSVASNPNLIVENDDDWKTVMERLIASGNTKMHETSYIHYAYLKK